MWKFSNDNLVKNPKLSSYEIKQYISYSCKNCFNSSKQQENWQHCDNENTPYLTNSYILNRNIDIIVWGILLIPRAYRIESIIFRSSLKKLPVFSTKPIAYQIFLFVSFDVLSKVVLYMRVLNRFHIANKWEELIKICSSRISAKLKILTNHHYQ